MRWPIQRIKRNRLILDAADFDLLGFFPAGAGFEPEDRGGDRSFFVTGCDPEKVSRNLSVCECRAGFQFTLKILSVLPANAYVVDYPTRA